MSTGDKLFLYDDYRRFLNDYFTEQKRLRETFSHRYFARRAGLSSPSFILDVCKGKYNITMKTLPRITRGLGLKGSAQQYFENLVWYNQSKDPVQRDEHYRALVEIRKKTRFYRLNENQYTYFEDYRYAVLRELVVYAPWNGNYETLGKLLEPPLSSEQARKMVETLVAIELLVEKENGVFEQSAPALTSDTIPSVISRPYRRQFLRLGIEAAEHMGPAERYCAHTTLSMSKQSFARAMEILDEARERIIRLALDDQSVEQVFALVLEQFPLSKQFSSETQHERVL